MTLNQFLETYDFIGSTVLLEGKRNVIKDDEQKLIALGQLLADSSKNITFRSGNAAGADYFFSKGVNNINKQRLEVITPYENHRDKQNLAEYTISLDSINILNEPEVIYQSKQNKKTEKLIDSFASGNKNKITMKAAYIIRDTIKVIGTSQIKKADFGIFYDDLTNPQTGGTGHTMNICKINKVPFIDQNIWLDWVRD
jgi:hypothetical protein